MSLTDTLFQKANTLIMHYCYLYFVLSWRFIIPIKGTKTTPSGIKLLKLFVQYPEYLFYMKITFNRTDYKM